MEKEREETRGLQGHGKEKDPVYPEMNKVWKLCSFILNETINVFVQMGVDGVCWNIVWPCKFIIA